MRDLRNNEHTGQHGFSLKDLKPAGPPAVLAIRQEADGPLTPTTRTSDKLLRQRDVCSISWKASFGELRVRILFL